MTVHTNAQVRVASSCVRASCSDGSVSSLSVMAASTPSETSVSPSKSRLPVRDGQLHGLVEVGQRGVVVAGAPFDQTAEVGDLRVERGVGERAGDLPGARQVRGGRRWVDDHRERGNEHCGGDGIGGVLGRVGHGVPGVHGRPAFRDVTGEPMAPRNHPEADADTLSSGRRRGGQPGLGESQCSFLVAAQRRERRGDPVDLGAWFAEFEDLVGPLTQLEAKSDRGEEAQCSQQLAGPCDVAGGRRPLQGRPEVVPLGFEGVHPVGVAAALGLSARARCRGQVVVEVPVPQRGQLAGLGQAFLAVLAEGLQQPVAGAGTVTVGVDHRLVDKGGQQVADVGRVDRVVGADRLGAVQVEPAGEDRQAVEEGPLLPGEELMGPLDRRPQRLMSFQAAPARRPAAAGSGRRAGRPARWGSWNGPGRPPVRWRGVSHRAARRSRR